MEIPLLKEEQDREELPKLGTLDEKKVMFKRKKIKQLRKRVSEEEESGENIEEVR